MFIRQLQLTNFKNHEKKVCQFTEKMTAFTGLNGVGKTNCLDAIYFLCIGKSYFTVKDAQCIKNGHTFFRLEMATEQKQVSIALQEGKKKNIQVNKENISKLSQYIGQFPVVMMAPNDTMLALGGSEERRKFMDQCLAQTDAVYLEKLNQYNNILKQRNALLKQAEEKGLNKTLLHIYNEDLVKHAHYVFEKRKEFVENMQSVFLQAYKFLSDNAEEVSLQYKSDLESGSLLEKLNTNLHKDIILKRTTKGVHKDDLLFGLKGFALKDFGSQGQQKTFLLALKLSQFSYLKTQSEQVPFFIVDDIFDKLDMVRSEKLLQFLQKEQGQVFISSTTSAIFDSFSIPNLQIIEIN